jgi:hypothetical protein
MSEQERSEFEDQYLVSDDVFEELVAAENDMIDAYVRGKLSEAGRRQFESSFLVSAERRKRVEFARSLMNYPAPSASRRQQSVLAFLSVQTPMPRFAVVAILLVTVVSGSGIIATNRRLRQELEQSRLREAEHQGQEQELRQQVTELNKELQQERVMVGDQRQEIAQLRAPSAAIANFALLADLDRGRGKENRFVVSPAISSVRLELNLNQQDYAHYGLLLETAEGNRIWQKAGLHSHPVGYGRIVTIEVPVSVLNNGDYVLKLSGTDTRGKVEEVEEYTFRIVKR